jgi:DNA-binding response OmpR family regulator
MKTILLVDDEYALLEGLAVLLEHEGYRVVTAANGKDALDRAIEVKPDLVLTDLMMPIADGRELVREMRKTKGLDTTPVVMMSASPRGVALSDDGATIEVAGYLRKPFRWESLRDAVIELIGQGERHGKKPT